MLATPQPGRFHVHADPAQISSAADLHRLLFPTVIATMVDAQRVPRIARDALPGTATLAKVTVKGTLALGDKGEAKRKPTVGVKSCVISLNRESSAK